ncbi:hypothetical protein EDC65_4379 [Stella humosa]|uniref:Uncharacterized protein n=1 Tax=Stella humosa TaxID=94 RepID=A0A3N1KYM5_9PROT|nr:hypothetical protein [Stella humosa]ROP83730.1 hypothetical protein EDC65_4379 [Stella humosa]
MKGTLFQLARRLASDPRVQEKAVEMLHRAKPKAQAAAAGVRAAARDVDPRQDPKGFLRRLKRGWDERDRT